MKVGDICTRAVVTVPEAQDLMAATQLMRKEHIGYLIVVEPGSADHAEMPIGVLTDRDIVIRVVAREAEVRSLRVGDVMTREPVLTTEDSPVSVALHYMREIGVRRLPVVDHRGRLSGVISLDDVLEALAAQLMDVASSIRSELKVESALHP